MPPEYRNLRYARDGKTVHATAVYDDGRELPVIIEPRDRTERALFLQQALERGEEIAPYEPPTPPPKPLTLEQLSEVVDWLMSGDPEPEPEPAPAPVEATPPDLGQIPEALAKYAQADETAADFRARLKLLWQRFGIEDGKHFPGGGEALTGEEKITMREIDIVLNSDDGKANGLLEWLLAEER